MKVLRSMGRSQKKVKVAMRMMVLRLLMPIMSEENAAQSRPTFYRNNLQIFSLV